MFTAIKTWFLSKFVYIFGIFTVVSLCATGFLYIEKLKSEKDLSKLKVELAQKNTVIEQNQIEIKYKNAIIESQKKSLDIQNKTIELANSMAKIKDDEIKKFNSTVDVKIKPISLLVDEIRNGFFDKPACRPSQSIKTVITTMQMENKK